MEGTSAKKSTSLETLVIQNISNVNDLKAKLNEIIKTGQDYEYDVSSCIKSLITNSSDQEIVLLSVQALSELVKCENKRETYAQKEIIEPVLKILQKEITTERIELMRQCCRALGNLCCDCDTSRNILLESGGVKILKNVLKASLDEYLAEIGILVCKTYLNFCLGGKQFTEPLVEEGIPEMSDEIFKLKLEKGDNMNDDVVQTLMVILTVINEHYPEILFPGDINLNVLNVLKVTNNSDLCATCLEHLHSQAEHESVKSLIAEQGGVLEVAARLEKFIEDNEAGELAIPGHEAEVEMIIKQACDLIVIVLTGDDAMHTLYKNGTGEVYNKMVEWLNSENTHLLTTAVLAIGNFARQDDYCTQMINRKIYEKLLDIFQRHQSLSRGGSAAARGVVSAALSAVRNLSVSPANKRLAPPQTVPLLLDALATPPQDALAAYRLLAALRMLLLGQEDVARALLRRAEALRGVVACGAAGGAAACEAARLLAWAVRELRQGPPLMAILEAEGCAALVLGLLLSPHAVMQGEALLALWLVAGEAARGGRSLAPLAAAELGKHVAVLLDANCDKMPQSVASNLAAFLSRACRDAAAHAECRAARVPDALQRFVSARAALGDELRASLAALAAALAADYEPDQKGDERDVDERDVAGPDDE